MPSRGASFLSGLIAMSLPPPLTQFVSVVTWTLERAASPSSTTSKLASTAGESSAESSVVNASSPSFRRISPRYEPKGLALEVTTSSGGGDVSVVNDQLASVATAFPERSFAPPRRKHGAVGRPVLERGLRLQRRHLSRGVVADRRRDRVTRRSPSSRKVLAVTVRRLERLRELRRDRGPDVNPGRAVGGREDADRRRRPIGLDPGRHVRLDLARRSERAAVDPDVVDSSRRRSLLAGEP